MACPSWYSWRKYYLFGVKDTDRFVGLDGWTDQTDWAEHGIDEQGSSSVKRTYQSVPLAKQKVVDEQLDKMLQQGIGKPELRLMSGLKGGPLRTFLSGSDQTLSWKE